jgi:hypothetical protein
MPTVSDTSRRQAILPEVESGPTHMLQVVVVVVAAPLPSVGG